MARPKLYSMCAFLCVVLGAAVARAEADTNAKLKSGEILAISVPGTGIRAGRAIAVVNAPADKVFDIIIGVRDYKHFIPRIIRSRKVAKKLFEVTAKLPWPFKEASVKLKLKKMRRGQKSSYVSWQMVEGGALKRYEGQAWVQPWGKTRSILTYEMLAVPSLPAPRSLMNQQLRRAVKGMVHWIRKRAATVTRASVGSCTGIAFGICNELRIVSASPWTVEVPGPVTPSPPQGRCGPRHFFKTSARSAT